MIIDCELYLLSWPVAGKIYDLPALEDLLDEAGIDMAILMPEPSIRPDNEALVRTIEGKERFIGCACLNPQFGEEAVMALERAVGDWGMRGLKLMPSKHGYRLVSNAPHPLMAKAAELGIPVSIHSGDALAHPLEIAVLAEAFPEVPIIMDHMGYRYYVSEAIAAAQRCPNIYLATTAVMEPHFIFRSIEALGAERIIFGSNGPFTPPRLQLEVIKFLNLPKEAERKILRENAARLYGLKQRPVPGSRSEVAE